MSTDISIDFIEGSRAQIAHARSRIDHCLNQLSDADVWWAPGPGSNPIGIIIQHLIGNLGQWAIAGVGGKPDVRDRPSEFKVAQQFGKAELQSRIGDVLDQVDSVYSKISAAELLESKIIQGFDITVLQAIYDTMCHLELHTGQILYLTRLRLGKKYKESWAPANKAQGGTGI